MPKPMVEIITEVQPPDSDDESQLYKRLRPEVNPEMLDVESISSERESPSRSRRSQAKKTVVHCHSHNCSIMVILLAAKQLYLLCYHDNLHRNDYSVHSLQNIFILKR